MTGAELFVVGVVCMSSWTGFGWLVGMVFIGLAILRWCGIA